MRDIVVLMVLIAIVIFILIKSFEPKIEIIQIGSNKYRVLLWYNSFERTIIQRKWIELF